MFSRKTLPLFARNAGTNEKGIGFRQWILGRNAVLRCLIYTGLIAAVVILGVYGAAYDTSQFLYTQF